MKPGNMLTYEPQYLSKCAKRVRKYADFFFSLGPFKSFKYIAYASSHKHIVSFYSFHFKRLKTEKKKNSINCSV